MKRQPLLVALFALVPLLSACSHDLVARVETSEAWTGTFDGSTVTGTGSLEVDIADETPNCVRARKQVSSSVRLRLSITDEGNAWLKWNGDTAETTTPLGSVEACADRQ